MGNLLGVCEVSLGRCTLNVVVLSIVRLPALEKRFESADGRF